MGNNAKDNTKAQLNTAHPAPNEDVQLTIETVTPDTHKAVPQAVVDSEESEQKIETSNNNDDSQNGANDVTVSSAEKDEDVSQAANEQNHEKNDDLGVSTEDTKGEDTDEDDERDKIETIAP